jgi:hypothetical protein
MTIYEIPVYQALLAVAANDEGRRGPMQRVCCRRCQARFLGNSPAWGKIIAL